jgi:hypothetical protein
MTSDIDRLQALYDIEAIKVLKARYFRFIDTKEWDSFRELFTDDARFDLPMDGDFASRDTFVATVMREMAITRTVHHGHMPEIEITSATTARGVWALADYVEFPSDTQRMGMKGYAHYHEEYRREGDDWKICALTLRYLRIDPLVGEPLPAELTLQRPE